MLLPIGRARVKKSNVWMFTLVECRETEGGREYMGKVSKTVTGKQCRKWSLSYTDDGPFPDGSLEEAENYCRNPSSSWTRGVWCYTTDPNEEWAACDVPLCGKSVAECASLRRMSLSWVTETTNRIKLQKTACFLLFNLQRLKLYSSKL